MRTIITLSSLGLTLALSGAALANPVGRSAFLERTGPAHEQMQNHYRHKRYYRHHQDRGEDSGTSRLQDGRSRDGVGRARPEVREPAVQPEPAVLRGPVARERPQIA